MKLGSLLAGHLKKGMTVLLKGDLASGKTTFTKGVGKGLHIRQPISSPTFNILKIYEGDLTLYHIDAYRLENSEYDLGFDEFLEDGVAFIEWPEYYERYLPKEYLEISFTYLDGDTREIAFHPVGKAYEELYEAFQGDL